MRAAIVAGGLVALLAVVAIGSRSQGWRGGDRREISPFAVDVAFTLAILLGIALLVVVVLTVRSAKGQVKIERPSGLARVVLVLAAFTFIGAFGLSRYEFRPNEDEENDEVLGPPTTTQSQDDVRTPERPREPRFQWWLAALAAGGTGAVVVVWYRRRRPPPRAAAAHDVAEELTEVLSDTLDDLAGERDPRRAVIRAYARMERVLASHGLPRAPHETPLEYLARVLRELNVRAEAAHALTELFERARFSQHEIDLAMKDEAIDALVRVRDDLEAAA